MKKIFVSMLLMCAGAAFAGDPIETVSVGFIHGWDDRWLTPENKMIAEWQWTDNGELYDLEMWVCKGPPSFTLPERFASVPVAQEVMTFEFMRGVQPKPYGRVVMPSGYCDPVFYLYNLKTGKRTEWVTLVSEVWADYRPPKHKSVWVWDARKGMFVLKRLWEVKWN